MQNHKLFFWLYIKKQTPAGMNLAKKPTGPVIDRGGKISFSGLDQHHFDERTGKIMIVPKQIFSKQV